MIVNNYNLELKDTFKKFCMQTTITHRMGNKSRHTAVQFTLNHTKRRSGDWQSSELCPKALISYPPSGKNRGTGTLVTKFPLLKKEHGDRRANRSVLLPSYITSTVSIWGCTQWPTRDVPKPEARVLLPLPGPIS